MLVDKLEEILFIKFPPPSAYVTCYSFNNTITKTVMKIQPDHLNIFVTNSSNYAARATHEDLTTSNIIIDTISPTITLNGKTIQYLY